mmetsp:Transcript_31905/g.102058  ORF Transcript_31905/g.102058 Transcript_31905/m.102058 type:complete len:398 (-) Transcript_31905:115-1308(-)
MWQKKRRSVLLLHLLRFCRCEVRSVESVVRGPPLLLSVGDVEKYPMARALRPCLEEQRRLWRDDVPGQPLHDDQEDQQQELHASCAVVGASDSLSSSRAGERIDAREAVLRAGSACGVPVFRDVGRKTTYCVGFWKRKPPRPSNFSLVIPLKSWNWVAGRRHNLTKSCLEKKAKLRWRFLHPEWIRATHRDLPLADDTLAAKFGAHVAQSKFALTSDDDGRIADFSSGFEAVLLALRVCRTPPVVFGFDLDTDANSPYRHPRFLKDIEHNRSTLADHRHPFALEREILLAWNASHLVSLVDTRHQTLKNNRTTTTTTRRQKGLLPPPRRRRRTPFVVRRGVPLQRQIDKTKNGYSMSPIRRAYDVAPFPGSNNNNNKRPRYVPQRKNQQQRSHSPPL